MLRSRTWLAFGPMVAALSIGAGCSRSNAPLAPPDSYLIFEPDPAAPATASGSAPASGLPRLREVAIDDPRALPVHRAVLDGFVGEILRTDYLAKQLIRDDRPQPGQPIAPAARRSADEPTILVLAGSRMSRSDEASLRGGFEVARSFGRIESHPDALAIDIGDDPVSDPAFVQTASGRIAHLVAERAAGAFGAPSAAAPSPRVLIDGYALAMEVIGREWRVGDGPRGVLPPEAGTGTQRERFAATRQNAFVFTPGDPHTLRPAADMLADGGVAAAVIYRMAQSTGVGRRVAPPEVYAPFVSAQVPPGISPAAVLGPVRNFQAKLLWAWTRAIREGHPPRDVVDLVNAYGKALPAERGEAVRIFVVTTYGATVKPGGVSPLPADATASFAELTALAAEATAGRRSLRAAIATP